MTEVGSDFGSADERLAALGYQPELIRTRSTWHVAFMSFVLASIPYGLTTTMYYSIANGGPVTVIWGWAAVSFFTLCVAISLAEIVSVFPCAGGVYYQTFMLSPPSYRKILSYICGWSFFVGNVTITLAVNFGTSLLWVACIQLFSADYLTETYQVYLIFVGVTLLCSAISTFGNRYLHILDTFAIFWTFAGTIAIVVVILALARNGRRSASYAFGHFEQGTSGWPAGWSFFVGLLQAAYASSSTGMIVSMCEEVAHPETQVPKAMVGTIGLNFICGMLFMIPLMFVLPNIADLRAHFCTVTLRLLRRDCSCSAEWSACSCYFTFSSRWQRRRRFWLDGPDSGAVHSLRYRLHDCSDSMHLGFRQRWGYPRFQAMGKSQQDI